MDSDVSNEDVSRSVKKKWKQNTHFAVKNSGTHKDGSGECNALRM